MQSMKTGQVTTLGELRAATWAIHQRMEKRIDVKARFSDAGLYCDHLARMWGFCAALESLLDPASVVAVLPDYGSRHKLDSLTRDLLVLGMPLEDIGRLPRCADLPAVPDQCAALGCLYVIEGATLGGRTILPLVERNLGFTAAQGAAFLASYGEGVGEMWRRFGAALEACCSTAARRDGAIAAAVGTFAALEGWLCGHAADLGPG